MKALKVFEKVFEASQGSVKIKILVDFYYNATKICFLSTAIFLLNYLLYFNPSCPDLGRSEKIKKKNFTLPCCASKFDMT